MVPGVQIRTTRHNKQRVSLTGSGEFGPSDPKALFSESEMPQGCAAIGGRYEEGGL